MRALITGASSGIGKEMAKYLATLGYDLYLVARNKEKLEDLKKELSVKVKIIEMDLTVKDNCFELHKMLKKDKIDILINNAGFGDYGSFNKTSIDKELDMIDLNIRAYHILTKLFLEDFMDNNHGRILNVASFAAFAPGPYMATYYATKAYVLNFSLAISEELKKANSKVKISVFCPGPVDTNFNNVANVKFKIKSITSEYAARYAIDNMFKNKVLIIPTNMQLMQKLIKISPTNLVLKMVGNSQEKND